MKRIELLSLLVLVISCNGVSHFNEIELDKLNFGEQSDQVEVFITGGITSQLAYHKLIIEKPGSIENQSKAERVTTANVWLVSGIDTIDYIIIDTIQYPYYRSKELAKAEFNKKYVLHIVYNGKLYTGMDEMIKVDSFSYNSINLPELDTNGQTSGAQEYMWFSMEKHSFGYELANMWSWVSHAGFHFSKNDSYLQIQNNVSFTHWVSDPNAIFSFNGYGSGFGPVVKTDTITTAKYSISDGYYQYLIALFSETDWKIGEFATQSGNLPTNFSEGAAGYFYVSDMYEKQIIVTDLLELID